MNNNMNNGCGVRPTFSLLPDITYKSGTGTLTDPVGIN